MSSLDDAKNTVFAYFTFNFQLRQLEAYQLSANPSYDSSSAIMRVFVITYFALGYLTIVNLAYSIFRIDDIFLLLLFIGQLINNFINGLLSEAIGIRQAPPLVGYRTFDTPGGTAQATFFFYAVLVMFPYIYWRGASAGVQFTLFLLPLLMISALLCLQYNTPQAVILGAAIGFALAGLFHAVLYAAIYPAGRWAVARIRRTAAKDSFNGMVVNQVLRRTDRWTQPHGIRAVLDTLHGKPWTDTLVANPDCNTTVYCPVTDQQFLDWYNQKMAREA